MVSEYSAAHLGARFLAAISGLILVRLLPIEEYGLYTLLLSAFTFICTFSDLGVTETLAFFRRRANKKNKPWRPYFHVVVRLRRTLFLVGFVLACIYIFLTGQRIGSETRTLLLAALIMGLGTWFAIQSGINTYVLKLEQYFRSAYATELSNEGAKMLGVSLIWALGLTTALYGMACVSIGAIIAAVLSEKLLDHAGYSRSFLISKHRVKRSTYILLGQVLPILPGSIHFAFQGILIASLAAYYGSVVNVAEVGALGRLAVIISILGGFTRSVVLPRLSSVHDGTLFFQRYLFWMFALLLSSMFIILMVWVFPWVLLFLLGDLYSDLHTEVVISVAAAMAAIWLGFTFNINRIKGWVEYQKWGVPITITGQICLFMFLDFSNTKGVLIFGLLSLCISFLYQLILNIKGFYVERNMLFRNAKT